MDKIHKLTRAQTQEARLERVDSSLREVSGRVEPPSLTLNELLVENPRHLSSVSGQVPCGGKDVDRLCRDLGDRSPYRSGLGLYHPTPGLGGERLGHRLTRNRRSRWRWYRGTGQGSPGDEASRIRTRS